MKSKAQKLAEKVIRANGGKKIGRRRYDMTRTVKDLKKKQKGKKNGSS